MDVSQWFTDLVRVETRLYNALEDALRAGHGLTAGQYGMLQVIARTPDCRVLDIAGEIAITVGAVSKSVDRLEAAGWCRRDANPHDRRSSYLTLTRAGEQMLAAATPTVMAALTAHLTGVVTDDALARSAETLAALRQSLEDRAPQDRAPEGRSPEGRSPEGKAVEDKALQDQQGAPGR